MNERLVVFLILSSLILTGFTIIDYNEYREPGWVWRDKSGYTIAPQNIKPKVENALKKTENKGLPLNDFTIYISPYTYEGLNGMAIEVANSIIIAKDSYNTIYHEFGHIYAFQHKNIDIVKRYAELMKYYYPDHIPKGTSWQKDIEEDFAEEFKKIFTGTPKRTAYPPFPNFYEWLLKNTQPIQITRKEVFDKLGGTQKLINEGIVIGNTLGDYMLDKPIKRSELATVLVRLGKGHKKGIAPFKDIKGKWYEDYVHQIYSTGLIKGYPGGSFKGERFATRYELHMILDRIK